MVDTPTATVTKPLSAEEIGAWIAVVVDHSNDVIDDEAVAVVIRERRGDKFVPLDEFLRDEGCA